MEQYLTTEQSEIVSSPIPSRIFLTGLAGTGKTTAAVSRMMALVKAGVPASSILILVPQRTLGTPYQQALTLEDFPPGGWPVISTLGGLAQRLIALFFPLIAHQAGFDRPKFPPSFLTLETSQYYLAQLVYPKLEAGYFQAVKIDRNRLLSQILDNLNKAAGVGFPYDTLADRLKSAWVGEPAQQRAYEEAQECAVEFRQYCLKNNLLDFSLQLETFINYLWPSFICRKFISQSYQHLIYDNIEEDVPVVHDIIRQWLPEFESALLISDQNGGFRSFLGADAESALTLQAGCSEVRTFTNRFFRDPQLDNFRTALNGRIINNKKTSLDSLIKAKVELVSTQFHPEMIEAVVERTVGFVKDQSTLPGQIAILAPFMPDSLRFSLMNELQNRGIPVRSHRPSRSLREEPASRCLLTLARLAHLQWNLPASIYDLRSAFVQAVDGMDLTRADLLAKIAYRPSRPKEDLGSFDKIDPDKQIRITYALGEKYEQLRVWVQQYRQNPPDTLDIFFSRLFGELLSQPGFGFHHNFDAADVAWRLIESVQKFRMALSHNKNVEPGALGIEYMNMVENGVIASQYLESWQEQAQADSVLIAPAHTFLMANQSVDHQFWLEAGSRGWWERLYQPLTHPFVLSRNWSAGRVWTDADEVAMNRRVLARLIDGLLLRCKKSVVLVNNRLNERGDEERGMLLQAVQGIFRQLATEGGDHV